MKAHAIMTTDVVTVGLETPVREIAALLLERRISAVPVVDAEQRALGIVSEGDLMRLADVGEHHRSWWLRMFGDSETLAQQYVKTHGRTAADVMTRHIVSVTEDAEAGYIADLLESRGIKRVPVVRDGRVVGIVSRADLLRALVAAPSGSAPSPSNDRALYEVLMSRVRAEPWANSLLLNIVVREGEVQLWGVTDSREQREALRLLAENVPGVRAVHDGLSVVPRRY